MLRYVKAERRSLAEFDQALVWTALILLVLGMVMVYSASIATAEASRFTGGSRPISWCGTRFFSG